MCWALPQSWNVSYIVHALQTDIRYEQGGVQSLARKDGGVKSAILSREEHYKEGIAEKE